MWHCLASCSTCRLLSSQMVVHVVGLPLTRPFTPSHGVTRRCRLSWLANSAPRIWAQVGGGGGGLVAGSQPMRTTVQITWHGAQINFGDLTPYLTMLLAIKSWHHRFHSSDTVRSGSDPIFSTVYLCQWCGPGFAFALIWVGYGSGSRWAKMTQKKEKSEEMVCFEVLDVLFWRLFGFSCCLYFCVSFMEAKGSSKRIILLYHFCSSNLWNSHVRRKLICNHIKPGNLNTSTILLLTRLLVSQLCQCSFDIIWLSDYVGHLPEQRGVQMGPPVRWLSVPLFWEIGENRTLDCFWCRDYATAAPRDGRGGTRTLLL